MAVYNVHERLLVADEDEVGALIDTLAAGENDLLWPRRDWPPLEFDRPLGPGAVGGHQPVGYTVAGYVPGRWIRFEFTRPRGFDGFHELAVLPAGPGRARLHHTLTMSPKGLARLTWPLAFRPLHDALLEDALDRAERATTGTVAHPARWSPYVRLLRAVATRGRRRPRVATALSRR
ncbi:SRPBCC family protein [Streptomyces durbertensis]|uniref:SRPBCC family protein n=1 Tax=Streptomyces durbertensis TaxID=2448886 RepID=A0ABR6EF17_9ACTN|nr:SRPBCC family protein [Streptomyces durbertensis]MBB1243910.1 SRPBCC family protein [Streptomyces durbertensis]